jgi:hypothetical protein
VNLVATTIPPRHPRSAIHAPIHSSDWLVLVAVGSIDEVATGGAVVVENRKDGRLVDGSKGG